MKKLYSFFLFGTLFLFIVKGVEYAVIGSFVPLLLSVLSILIALLVRKSNKRANKAIKFWAILILFWSIGRIVISVIDAYAKELTENQILENSGVLGTIISISFLLIGLFLINKTNRNSWLQQQV